MKKTLFFGITTLKGAIADAVNADQPVVVRSLPIQLHNELAITPPDGGMPEGLRAPYMASLNAAKENPGTPVHVDFSAVKDDNGVGMPDDYDDYLIAVQFDVADESEGN